VNLIYVLLVLALLGFMFWTFSRAPAARGMP
jgi:hypothetical protein